ncbi:crotonase/enoyl-CoA hydratase family protein [Rhodococcus sp. X156]|uniref:crotonase/enoyl-CoA hydratase family protein n=1 Tax=Rhodococcus sp. X156 TaxID=2499145 RepID=UPI000FD82DAA|nr:crotonase/enoyl-CoA hydratase family protein [Rhodococcus sp. X156]
MTDEAPEAVVLTERRGHTLLITINRPKASNSINADVHNGIGEALEQAENDPEIRAVVLTGAGDRVFCGGADLKALGTKGGDGVLPPETKHWGFAGMVDHPVSVPVIAAVNGSAMGGGTELALASDLIVAADNAKFGLPEVHRGLMAAAGGVFRLTQALPKHVALELILTGEPMPATDAHRWGFVNRVVPQDQVLDTALALAEQVSAGAPLAVQASKRVARGIVDGSTPAERDAWKLNDEEMAKVSTSADVMEGIGAFMEKRQPSWQGK